MKVIKQVQALPAPSASPDIVKVSLLARKGMTQISRTPLHLVTAVCDYLQVLAVFPFFQADLSNRQQKMMHALTRVPRVMGALGAVLGALPLAVQRWLVNRWAGAAYQPSVNIKFGSKQCAHGIYT